VQPRRVFYTSDREGMGWREPRRSAKHFPAVSNNSVNTLFACTVSKTFLASVGNRNMSSLFTSPAAFIAVIYNGGGRYFTSDSFYFSLCFLESGEAFASDDFAA